MRYCKDQHIFVKNLRIFAEDDSPAKYSAILELRGSVNKDLLVDHIRIMPGIVSASEK